MRLIGRRGPGANNQPTLRPPGVPAAREKTSNTHSTTQVNKLLKRRGWNLLLFIDQAANSGFCQKMLATGLFFPSIHIIKDFSNNKIRLSFLRADPKIKDFTEQFQSIEVHPSLRQWSVFLDTNRVEINCLGGPKIRFKAIILRKTSPEKIQLVREGRTFICPSFSLFC